MTEEFALQYAELRRKQLGAESFDVNFRHLALANAESREFQAQGQMWLLTQADAGVRIESDMGQYYLESNTLLEHSHEHTGQLKVANQSPAIKQVRFVVITWHYKRSAAQITPIVTPAPLETGTKPAEMVTVVPAKMEM